MGRFMGVAVIVAAVILGTAAVGHAAADLSDRMAVGPAELAAVAPCQPWRPLQKIFGHPADHFVSAPPGAFFHPQTVPSPHPPGAGSVPVPAFNWGYFGARSEPRVSAHRTYGGVDTNTFWPGR